MLAEAGTTTRLTLVAPRAVLAEAGAAAFPALVAPLAVLADAGAAARSAIVAPLVVRALLADVAPYWVRRRGGGRCCRNCCSCLHGAKWQRHVFANLAGAFDKSRGHFTRPLDAPPPTTCRAPGPLTWDRRILRTTRRLGRLRRARRTVPKSTRTSAGPPAHAAPKVRASAAPSL